MTLAKEVLSHTSWALPSSLVHLDFTRSGDARLLCSWDWMTWDDRFTWSNTGWHSFIYHLKNNEYSCEWDFNWEPFPVRKCCQLFRIELHIVESLIVATICLWKPTECYGKKDNSVLVLIRTTKNVSLCKSISKNDNRTVQKPEWKGNMKLCALWEFIDFDMIVYLVIL